MPEPSPPAPLPSEPPGSSPPEGNQAEPGERPVRRTWRRASQPNSDAAGPGAPADPAQKAAAADEAARKARSADEAARKSRSADEAARRARRLPSAEATGWLRPLWVAAGAVLVVGLVVALAVTSVRLAHRDAVESTRSGALAAARTYSVEVASYDYADLAQSLSAVLQHATPSFKQQFESTSRALEPAILEYQGIARATVLQAGVAQSTGDQATVVLFLDQTITNARLRQPQVNHDRMVMSLTRQGGQWLISRVSLA